MNGSNATQLLDEARRLGFEVCRDGDRLHVEGPRDAEWFVEKLAQAKPDILAALDRPHCIVLRTEPYPDETDAADPVDGRRIVQIVKARGVTAHHGAGSRGGCWKLRVIVTHISVTAARSSHDIPQSLQ